MRILTFEELCTSLASRLRAKWKLNPIHHNLGFVVDMYQVENVVTKYTDNHIGFKDNGNSSSSFEEPRQSYITLGKIQPLPEHGATEALNSKFELPVKGLVLRINLQAGRHSGILMQTWV